MLRSDDTSIINEGDGGVNCKSALTAGGRLDYDGGCFQKVARIREKGKGDVA